MARLIHRVLLFRLDIIGICIMFKRLYILVEKIITTKLGTSPIIEYEITKAVVWVIIARDSESK